jgi:multiple sugar transport system substrate-binding protein
MSSPKSSRGRRTIAALAAGLTTLLATAACGVGSTPSAPSSDGDGDVTLTFQWWGNDDRAKATQEVVDLYESKNPGITIETSFAPDANYWEKMATQVAGGSTPDIFQMKLEYLKEYQSRGVIADLTPFTEGDEPLLHTSAMRDQYLAAGQIDGKTYGLPTGRSTQALFYDPKAWSDLGLAEPTPGWTWDDLIAAGQKVKEASGGKQAVMADFGGETPWFEGWLLQRGKSLYTADGQLNFTQADLEEFWSFTSGLAADGILTPAEVTTANDRTIANSPLVKGAALAELNDVSLASSYFDGFGEVALAPLPTSPDAATSGSFAGVTQLLTVSNKSAHQEEAAKFIDFFLNDPEAGKILGLVRGMPANQDVLEALSSSFEGGDKATYEFEQLVADDIVARPPVAPEGGSQSITDFKNEYDQVIFGRESVADAAKSMFAAFESNIS